MPCLLDLRHISPPTYDSVFTLWRSMGRTRHSLAYCAFSACNMRHTYSPWFHYMPWCIVVCAHTFCVIPFSSRTLSVGGGVFCRGRDHCATLILTSGGREAATYLPTCLGCCVLGLAGKILLGQASPTQEVIPLLPSSFPTCVLATCRRPAPTSSSTLSPYSSIVLLHSA